MRSNHRRDVGSPSPEGAPFASRQRRPTRFQTRSTLSQQANAAAQRFRALQDDEALGQCAADAGVNVFGCVFVELWALSDDGTMLSRPEGGHWMDPAFAQSLPSEELAEQAWLLDREAEDCPPGVGLAGTLADDVGLASRAVYFRQLKRLMEDPFVQRHSSNRMARLYEIGIGIVAAVPFHVENNKGLVLFYFRLNADWKLSHSKHNEKFMLISTDFIGANYVTRKARQAHAELRKSMMKESARKVMSEMRKEMRLRNKKTMTLSSMVLFDKDAMERLRKMQEQAALGAGDPREDKLAVKLAKGTIKNGKEILKRAKNSCGKWGGANLHGPPRHSLADSLFTFTGCFVTMLVLLNMETYFQEHAEFNFNPGWYASTLCIVHAMTPAPVGQPRQLFAAHAWNMLVGVACRRFVVGAGPDARYGLPLIYMQAISVALGVSGQAFLGLMHPPATGLSVLFTTNPRWTLGSVAPVMLADVAVVAVSVIFLNLSDKKQYPLFWIGLGWQGSGGTWGYLRSKSRSATRAFRHARKHWSAAMNRQGKGSTQSPPSLPDNSRTPQHLSPTKKGYNTMDPSSHCPRGNINGLQVSYGDEFDSLNPIDGTVSGSWESSVEPDESPK